MAWNDIKWSDEVVADFVGPQSLSNRALARKYGIALTTVRAHRRRLAEGAAGDFARQQVEAEEATYRIRTQLEREGVWEDLAAGRLSMRAAAARIKVSPATLRKHLNRLGLSPHLCPVLPNHEELKAWYDQGMSTAQIAERYAVPPTTVRRWARKLGIPLRPGPKRRFTPEEAKQRQRERQRRWLDTVDPETGQTYRVLYNRKVRASNRRAVLDYLGAVARKLLKERAQEQEPTEGGAV